MAEVRIQFMPGDRVNIDNDKSIVAYVIGIAIYSAKTEVKISWVHAGDIKEHWVDEWRLTAAL